jgi:minor extracellular serine protease Vpr
MSSRYSFAVFVIFLLSALLLPGQSTGVYIVELESPPAVDGFRAGSHRIAKQAFTAARSRVRDGQERYVRAVQNRRGRVLYQADTILNAVIVELPSAAEAAQLAALPGVKNVREAREVRAQLDRLLPLHKIPEAWNNLPGGPDSAGKGIKVGVVDTGVDIRHPAFVDDSLPAVEGYPKFGESNAQTDRDSINPKIVVMRSYENLVDRFAPARLTANDGTGHGTGVAMAAVGKRVEGPHGPISGVAPGAYLGVYRITAAGSNGSTDAAIMAALDDAVKDGMDVINLSFGSALTPDDNNDEALQRIADAGVILVCALGNQGPGLQSAGWPGSSRHVIGVGASGNDRTISSRAFVRTDEGTSIAAIPGSNSIGKGRFTAPLKDAASLNNALGCDPFPAGSLDGGIALILRGSCNFSVKLDNARRAGAIAAVVYNPEQVETGVTMLQDVNFLPSVWVNNDAGLLLKAKADSPITVDLIPPITPDRLAVFSAMGPSTGSLLIKPDLVAVGDYFVTAAPTLCCAEWANEAGYPLTPGFLAIQGTSQAAPVVAGAAAVLKQSRPGLSQQQYKSLLTNSARPMFLQAAERNAIPFEAGVGRLDLLAAQTSNASVWPTTLSFGGGTADPARSRRALTITNLGTEPATYSIAIEPIGDSAKPELSTESVSLEPNAFADVEVAFSGSGLRAGHHHGILRITNTQNSNELRVPYWYGVASKEPGSIALIVDPNYLVGPQERTSFTFRVTDTSGQGLNDVVPEIEIVSGVGSFDPVTPHPSGNGLFRGTVRAGRSLGDYVFRIKAGSVSYVFYITVQ